MISAFTVTTFRPTHPLRAPAWRWAAAKWVRDGAPANPRTAPDDHVKAAAQFQRVMAEGNEAQRAREYERSPDLTEAFHYHQWGTLASEEAVAVDGGDARDPYSATCFGPLTAPAMALAELEALILAGKPAAKIAVHTGLSVGAVGWYERLWFDVRDRLNRAGWVAANVIGSLHQGTVGALLPALVRAYGYYTKKARIVRAVVAAFDAPAARAAAEDPARFFLADAASAGGMKAALAVRLLPLNKRTYARVVELHHQAIEVDAKAKLTDASTDEAKFRQAAELLAGRIDKRYGAAPVETADFTAPGPRLLPAAAPDHLPLNETG